MTLAWGLLFKLMPPRDRGAVSGLAIMTKGVGLLIGTARRGRRHRHLPLAARVDRRLRGDVAGGRASRCCSPSRSSSRLVKAEARPVTGTGVAPGFGAARNPTARPRGGRRRSAPADRRARAPSSGRTPRADAAGWQPRHLGLGRAEREPSRRAPPLRLPEGEHLDDASPLERDAGALRIEGAVVEVPGLVLAASAPSEGGCPTRAAPPASSCRSGGRPGARRARERRRRGGCAAPPGWREPAPRASCR